jgi:site-specific recombinase XerD
LDALLNIRDLALFEILYATGMRLSELIGLTLGDIAGADGTITIHDGKGGKDRVVPIGNKAVGAIGRYCSETRPFLTCSVVVTDRLFLNRWGRPIGQQGIRCIVNKHIRQAGITKHIRVHDVRHTCATHMLNSGADIRYVQELLGHASLSSTQVYTHVSITKLKETHTKHHPRERDTFLPPAESECNHGV